MTLSIPFAYFAVAAIHRRVVDARREGVDKDLRAAARRICRRAKYPVTGIQRRDSIFSSPASDLADPFVIDEEEGLVFYNRASKGPPELVAVKWCDCRRRVEEVFRIQALITEKPVGIAVKTIGPLLQHRVNYRARSPPVFRRVVCGHDGKFLNPVHTQLLALDATRRPVRIVVDVDPIDPVSVLRGAVTVSCQLVSEAAIAPID